VTGFCPSTSVFPCQFHSTGAPLLGNGQKIIIIIVIFITGLHKKLQGCGASVVASAAGPFINKKKGKGKCHEGPEGKWRYSCTVSLTSALRLEWIVNATPRPVYALDGESVPTAREAGLTSMSGFLGDVGFCGLLRYYAAFTLEDGTYTSSRNIGKQ
jgi:hypothetical protein